MPFCLPGIGELYLCDNVLGPYLERHLIYDNSACRKGKGTHFALDRLTCFLRKYYRSNGSNGYILKCDVRKYFNSIDHEVLRQKIRRMDLPDDVKWLLDKIIGSYEYEEGKGLPMGNQTSQWFALYYLDSLDRLVKEKLRIRYYSRYMDDMILIHRQSGKKRLKRKLRHYRRAFADGKIELGAIGQSVASFKGHLKHGHTYRLQKNVWNQFVLNRKKQD